jgi:hypothetical protein
MNPKPSLPYVIAIPSFSRIVSLQSYSGRSSWFMLDKDKTTKYGMLEVNSCQRPCGSGIFGFL